MKKYIYRLNNNAFANWASIAIKFKNNANINIILGGWLKNTGLL